MGHTHDSGDISRRNFLRAAGVLGAGAAVGVAGSTGTAAAVDSGQFPARSVQGRRLRGGYHWLVGDHHAHSLFSRDGLYRVIDHVRHANAYGLDFLALADHGHEAHARVGLSLAHQAIAQARAEVPDTLVFQALEWNVPAGEHATVIVHPGADDVAVLTEFQLAYDAALTGDNSPTPENEALALAGVNFLAGAVAQGRLHDAVFIVNHPSRLGVYTPHEMRAWRDAQPHIAIGFEAAPGHQAAGIAPPFGLATGRGLYDRRPGPASFPAYPAESYRTWGGFDFMTATVGGLWDSLLAEGRPWVITANEDSHYVYSDPVTFGPNSDYLTKGYVEDPVYGGFINIGYPDYWPGQYTRTHVGVRDFSYAAVLAGLRAGRTWVDHGCLVSAVDVRMRSGGRTVTLGDTLSVRPGRRVELVIEIDLANGPNWAQFTPKLARVDVIRGQVTGPVADRDTFTTPNTAVVQSYEVNASTGTVSFTYDLGTFDGSPYYVRLRGTDGRRSAPGYLGASVDPAGPAMDIVGNSDPWTDLWFYTNAIFVARAQ